MARYNEGKTIDAVIKRIVAREHSPRITNGFSPDDLNDPNPQRRVDYVCTIGDKLYAFEHTGIEPFDNQIKMYIDNRALFEPVVQRFDKRRSDGEFWELRVPVDASMGLERKEAVHVSRALVNWIEANAIGFPLARYGDGFVNKVLGETVVGVPFPTSLHRWSFPSQANLSNRFTVKPVVTNNLEQMRLVRLRKACQKKFPKLSEWKSSEGASTVLILEENDISSTNHQLVAESFAIAEAEMFDPPDEVFLVSTPIEHLWLVTCLRREGKTYYDDHERFFELDPLTLTRLTKG